MSIPCVLIALFSIILASSFSLIPAPRKPFISRLASSAENSPRFLDSNNATRLTVNYEQDTTSFNPPPALENAPERLPDIYSTQILDTLTVPKKHSLRHALNVEDNIISRRNVQKVVGHRGALYDALENTREAFLRCVDIGCDAVELDVFTLEDEESGCPVVVVFHGGGSDQTPGDLSDYCLNNEGVSILDLSYQQSQKLKFNPDHAEFPCSKHFIESARIPTLEEVLLDLKGTGVKVKIELKGPGTVEPTLALVERLHMTDQCAYGCFDHEKLRHLRQLRPDRDTYPTGALFGHELPGNYIELAKHCGATEIHLQYDTCTVERVNAIREAGMRSMAWFRGPEGMTDDVKDRYWDIGNEDERCYEAVLDTGVDELCVNKPDILKSILLPEQLGI